MSAEIDTQIEWRERVGVRLMMLMPCAHEGAAFGPRAVCEACFASVQRIGSLVEGEAARAWDRGRSAERRDWEFTADLVTPDEARQSLPNPYRVIPPVVGESQ